MAKYAVIREDATGWDKPPTGGVPGVFYPSKALAKEAAISLVNDNIKNAYLIVKVQSRVAAVVTIQEVDDTT